jgi:hypothetical protein
MWILALLAGCGGPDPAPAKMDSQPEKKHEAKARQDESGRRLLSLEIVSVSVAGEIDWRDPEAAAWNAVPAVTVKLIPQEVQEPKLTTPGIGELRVRSVHDASWIAFLLEWDDDSKSAGLRSDRFGDACAVELPLATDPLPDYRMGDETRPVQLALWRAERQRAIEEGISFHQENYPYQWTDAYTFEPKAVGAENSQATNTEKENYVGSKAAHNPAVVGVAPIVEELIARTWNKLAHQQRQDSRGRGVWKDGKWRVIIARPLATSDEEDAVLAGRENWAVAFAAWDGGKQNAGPRKMVAEGWLKLKIGK